MNEQPMSPALMALRRELAGRTGWDFAELRLTPLAAGGELRHIADAEYARAGLQALTLGELRGLAQTTAEGAFRPVKTAPNLRRGWYHAAATDADLESALDVLYPGALVDWWSAAQADPPVQHYREFTARQSGIYRVTQQLSDAEAAAVIRAGCHAESCLRRRHWSVAGLRPEGAEAGKSVIPCLEPCPVLLEFARQAAVSGKDESMPVPLSTGALATLVQALDLALQHPLSTVREGDLAHPGNPRRIRLLRDRIQGLLPDSSADDANG